MDIKTKVVEDKATIEVEGKLTVQSAPDLEGAIGALPPNLMHVDIDLEGLDYLSSAGLRVLVSAQKMLSQRGGTLRLLSPNDDVSDVFDMTGLSEVFTIER